MPEGDRAIELRLVERNRQHSSADPSAHAEMVLLRQATRQLGHAALHGATVYASGEPCAMCTGALYWAGVARVVWAAPQPAIAELLGGPLLPVRCHDILQAGQPPVAVSGECLADEALAVLREAAARAGR